MNEISDKNLKTIILKIKNSENAEKQLNELKMSVQNINEMFNKEKRC